MYGNAATRAEQRASGEAGVSATDMLDLQTIIEKLMSRLRLAVIFGGNKTAPGSVIYPAQNTRSWKSYEPVAEDIAASLRRIGFRHVELMPEDMRLAERLAGSGIHMAWLNTGGVQGYNSAAHAPATLEMLGIPYVGHDPLAASTLDNKHAFKREAVCAGLPTAPFSTWHMARGPFLPTQNSRFGQAFGHYAGPFIVKPVSGRASLHVHVVSDRKALPDAVAEVYRETGNLVLIEKYLSGREFCISVAGPITARDGVLSRGKAPFSFGALERVFDEDELIFTSMDVKPITANRFKSIDPLEPQLSTSIHKIAREVFLEFHLGTLVRLDLRADRNGQLYILEANPKPDLKYPSDGVTSLVSAGLSQINLSYDDLILSLFSDRVDVLLSHRRGLIPHIIDLLGSSNADVLGTGAYAEDLDKNADAMVRALDDTARQMVRPVECQVA